MTFDRSIECLRQHSLSGKRQPLFLNISLTQPHDPFTTTQEFLDLYKGADIPLPKDHGDSRRLSPTSEWFVITGWTRKPSRRRKYARRSRRDAGRARAMVETVDAGVVEPRAADHRRRGAASRSGSALPRRSRCWTCFRLSLKSRVSKWNRRPTGTA
jgi:hypothetical protein